MERQEAYPSSTPRALILLTSASTHVPGMSPGYSFKSFVRNRGVWPYYY